MTYCASCVLGTIFPGIAKNTFPGALTGDYGTKYAKVYIPEGNLLVLRLNELDRVLMHWIEFVGSAN